MRRRLFAIVSAVSLLLCVAILVLWPASHWISHEIQWDSGRGSVVVIETKPGEFLFGRYKDTPIGDSRVGWRQGWWGTRVIDGMTVTRSPGVSANRFLVFGWDSRPRVAYFTVPMWLVCVSLLPLPAHLFYKRLRRSRDRERLGLCPSCGYDTRETRDQCPECGTFLQSI